MLDRLLRGAGYEVIVAPNSNAAAALIRSNRVDLLLSAMTITPLTGVELAEFAVQLRRKRPV